MGGRAARGGGLTLQVSDAGPSPRAAETGFSLQLLSVLKQMKSMLSNLWFRAFHACRPLPPNCWEAAGAQPRAGL